MTQHLFCRRGTFYFRRRIAGYPHKSPHLMVSLGSKDKSQALYLVQQLRTEYQTMHDAFIFMQPPLPEHLVRSYMQTRLRAFVDGLQRNLRMARMSGRFSAKDQDLIELRKIVLRTMLTHGVNTVFPPRAINPDWSGETLAAAMRIYDAEYRAVMDPENRQAIKGEFIEMAHADHTVFNSYENECHVREMYLQTKLAAYETALDPSQTPHMALLDQEVPASYYGNASQEPLPPLPSVSYLAPVSDSASAPSPVSDSSSQIQTVDQNTKLTIRMLRSLHQTAKARDDNSYTSDIASIFWRMAKTDDLSEDVAKQRASDLRLFSLITGILDVSEIQQFHLSQYRDALVKVPRNFLRSQRDADLTIEALMARARLLAACDVGLAPDTMRRHFKSFELMLERAKSEGHKLTSDLETKTLKPKKKSNKQAHRRRAAFRLDDLKKVFAHTAWQGYKGKSRHVPGSNLLKNSRYWVPIILAYTGARRAEISGMLRKDIETIDGIPCIHIRANAYRKIKGENGEIEKSRIIPIHSHLIELGLLEHAKASHKSRTGLMFPDILPKQRDKTVRRAATEVKKIGESLDDFWRKSLRLTLDENPRNLCMHSMRHYVNNHLIHANGVHEVTRLDLLGHVEIGDEKQSVNTSTYRDETPLAIKQAAIETLPAFF